MRVDESGTAPRGVAVHGVEMSRSSASLVVMANGRLIEVPMQSIAGISGPGDAVDVVLMPDARVIVHDPGTSPIGLIASDVFGHPLPLDWIAECYSACNCNCNCSSGGGNCNCNCNCSSVSQAELADPRSRFRQPLPPVPEQPPSS